MKLSGGHSIEKIPEWIKEQIQREEYEGYIDKKWIFISIIENIIYIFISCLLWNTSKRQRKGV